MRAETHFRVVDREMRHAAAEFEQPLAWIAVTFVLLDRVFDGLLRQAVFQFEGRNRQPVDEQREIEGVRNLIVTVTKLPRDRETIQSETPRGLCVAGRRRAVEECDVMRAVLDAVAQDIDDPAPADLALEAGEELLAYRAVVVEIERRQQGRLRGRDEGAKLKKVDGPGAIIGFRIAEHPVVQTNERLGLLGKAGGGRGRDAAGHLVDDEGFQALFRRVGRHIASISVSPRSSADRTSGSAVSNQASSSRRRVFGSLIQMTAGPLSVKPLRWAKSSSLVTM